MLPREMPHKTFHGAPFQKRLEMLIMLAHTIRGYSVATTSEGLYIDIAHDAAAALGPGCRIHLLCGRDAADRIASWHYDREGVFEEMLRSYPLLVAAREGHYSVAPRHRERIVPITMKSSFNSVSSSDVRARIAAGREWKHLVPEAIHTAVSQLYHEEHGHAAH